MFFFLAVQSEECIGHADFLSLPTCRTFARAPGPSESAALEKELNGVRTKFQDAKNKYTSLSTSLIDKAGLLDLKKGVDFAAHIQKIRQGMF